MTDTIAPKTGSHEQAAKATAKYLEPVVQQLIALQVNGKQAHWHVQGPTFIAIHELLDDVVDHAKAWSDLAAERIVALGLPVDGRLATAAGAGSFEPAAGFQSVEETIADVIAQIDIATSKVNEAIDGLETPDPASQDVAIEIRQGLDKDRWFLFSHIAGK
ncbi:Dps family protein [Agromyces archimandritae]|uniref:DNA starvation/stationary phase protection protein n=1 Tax=Agromyces archimandritae TaxID=2781962 RepID=A0A975FL86_9MICO|nr:DNA starvation/stationary phase protection protein [Agromyces archimandritae]QTX04563.1 DNA starvation/stationary phase protection protein [Agromyces archimandritae]